MVVLETTRDKAKRLLDPATQRRLQENGLTVVDRDDLKLVLDGYREAQMLKARLRKLERERSGAR